MCLVPRAPASSCRGWSAQATTVQLEFAVLSRHTRDPKYHRAVCHDPLVTPDPALPCDGTPSLVIHRVSCTGQAGHRVGRGSRRSGARCARAKRAVRPLPASPASPRQFIISKWFVVSTDRKAFRKNVGKAKEEEEEEEGRRRRRRRRRRRPIHLNRNRNST